jgi:Ca2+-binding RTX toxin-like protein
MRHTFLSIGDRISFFLFEREYPFIRPSYNLENINLNGKSITMTTIVDNDLSHTITGTINSDTISAQGGDDTVRGGGGNDFISGGSGGDVLFGEAGNDFMTGDAGQDFMFGGLGSDTMTGGAGDNSFPYSALAESLPGTAHDNISDFVHNVDKIDLHSIDAVQSLTGNQAFKFIGTGNFGFEGDLRVAFANGNTLIQGNTDTDITPEFEIQLSGLHTISSTDFFL